MICKYSYCSVLTSIEIPNGVTSVGNSAFGYCSGLTSVTINSSDVMSNTYTSSSNLKTIFGGQVKQYVIGDEVTSIGKYAFSGCTTLTKLISLAANPPACGTNALNDINKLDCTLTIPENTLAKYQAADQWKDFSFIEEKDLSGINAITMDDGTEMEIKETFDINGKKTTGLQRGMNIVKLKNGTLFKVVVK